MEGALITRRTLKRFLWTAAVVATLGVSARAMAKPPDLPANTDNTVTPEVLPDAEWNGIAPLPGDRELPASEDGTTLPTGEGLHQPPQFFNAPPPAGIVPGVVPAGFLLNDLSIPINGQNHSIEQTPVQFRVMPTTPLMAHLPAVQRRQFAATMLLGVHPLLAVVPTVRLVDMPCDHPPCMCGGSDTILVQIGEDNNGSFIIGSGPTSDAGLTGSLLFTGDTGLKCEIVPMPKGVHGTIEIGIGFSLNGAPTCKCEVIEFWGCGNVRKDHTFQGCWETFLGVLKRDAEEAAEPCPSTCPYLLHKEKPAGSCDSAYSQLPSVLENLENLAQAQELREKGRRLAEDGFAESARKCFEEAAQLCPGCPHNREVDEPACEEEEGPSHLCIPGVQVMVDGLMKGCHQALTAGRFEHAVDLARQAYALDHKCVEDDPVVFKLHLLADVPNHNGCCPEKKAGCCENCPGCPLCQEPKTTAHKVPYIILNVTPMLPRVIVDPKTIDALDDVLRSAEYEEQEEHIFQKSIAKPYRETNDAPPSVGKSE